MRMVHLITAESGTLKSTWGVAKTNFLHSSILYISVPLVIAISWIIFAMSMQSYTGKISRKSLNSSTARISQPYLFIINPLCVSALRDLCWDTSRCFFMLTFSEDDNNFDDWNCEYNYNSAQVAGWSWCMVTYVKIYTFTTKSMYNYCIAC